MASATVLLSLSHEEAQTLADICARIGGNGKTTRRKHADAILTALSNMGVSDSDQDDIDTSLKTTRGTIVFK